MAGLATTEIAHAFLVPETTMAQRLVRAKRKIKEAGIPYITPPKEQWEERLDAVLAVIYLIFNEGYAATTGREPTRTDLCREAIRLGGIVFELAPRGPEAAGLLALMLLHDSRRSARTDSRRRLVTLEDQDRSLWVRARIERGMALLETAAALDRIGPFQIQAAVSAEHARADRYEATNWHRITRLYESLYVLQPSPVVKLNGAVALSLAGDIDAGLAALAALAEEGRLSDYQPFHAALADMLLRAHRPNEAARAYERALSLTQNEADRWFLEKRLRQALDAGGK